MKETESLPQNESLIRRESTPSIVQCNTSVKSMMLSEPYPGTAVYPQLARLNSLNIHRTHFLRYRWARQKKDQAQKRGKEAYVNKNKKGRYRHNWHHLEQQQCRWLFLKYWLMFCRDTIQFPELMNDNWWFEIYFNNGLPLLQLSVKSFNCVLYT